MKLIDTTTLTSKPCDTNTHYAGCECGSPQANGTDFNSMAPTVQSTCKKIVLVGNPNVGKSVIFRLLTGSYVVVSNFPGTTVEISRGRLQLGAASYEVIDTPGTNSLVPQSEDEQITCEILLTEKPDVIVQVADAKNLRRTLLLTTQLAEFGTPMVLVLNMMDEAEERGIEIDTGGLSQLFSIPLIEMVAIYSRGRKQLLGAIQSAGRPASPLKPMRELPSVAETSPTNLAIEWLSLGDQGLLSCFEQRYGKAAADQLTAAVDGDKGQSRHQAAREVARNRTEFLEQAVAAFKNKRRSRFADDSRGRRHRAWLALLLAGIGFTVWNEAGPWFGLGTPYIAALSWFYNKAGTSAVGPGGLAGLVRGILLGSHTSGHWEYGLVPELIHLLLVVAPIVVPFAVLLTTSRSFVHEFGILTRRAATGIPILLLVLLIIYEFVGFTGAQTLVGLLERNLFGEHLIPAIRHILPGGFWGELIAGRYGLVSMGLTYAIGIVLPVVGTFFIAFGLLEDSGYLPRLSILTDRVMRAMGLNGKATLPMVLGLGCCTMATMTTRILGSKKERLIATFLLALGIPCSAQLGVILGIAASFSFKATLTVVGVVVSQLLLVGYLSSLLIRGKRSEFLFEIPPIRVPQLRNVALKTAHRIRWYLAEAVPLFLYGTLALFVLDKAQFGGRSLLQWIEAGLRPILTGILHLPPQAAPAFVLGFLRRDYGAAGLFELARSGVFTGQQAVVSLIVITLFVPCIASFLIMAKEQGLKKALAITGFIIPFAITVGGVVGWMLRTFNINFP
jgi:ferrous iron transport protein B